MPVSIIYAHRRYFVLTPFNRELNLKNKNFVSFFRKTLIKRIIKENSKLAPLGWIWGTSPPHRYGDFYIYNKHLLISSIMQKLACPKLV